MANSIPPLTNFRRRNGPPAPVSLGAPARWVAALGFLLLLAQARGGTNLVYSFQGTASGTVGGVPFTSASFTIQLAANTANVTNFSSGFYSATGASVTIAIAGIGSGVFTTPKRVYAYQPGIAVGFGVAPNGQDELDMQSSDFADYDLQSPLDPVFTSAPSYLGLNSDPTTLGSLTFTSASNLTFMAVTTTLIPGPPLVISRTGASVVLHWPTNAVGFTLQSAAAAYASANWTAVTNVPVVAGTEKFVTNAVLPAAKFYRLIQ